MMTTLTAEELRERDPKRFDREYYKWLEYACDYKWWDYIADQFKAKVADAGVTVQEIAFNLTNGRGDYARFTGTIQVHKWMDVCMKGDQTYAERYPALRLAVEGYGEYAKVDRGYYSRDTARVNLEGNCLGNTYPAGIFENIDPDAWDELVEEQYFSSGLEEAMQDYVNALCNSLYSDLSEEHEGMTSEDAFIESCECNEVTFEIELEEEAS
jgi:hypothetical protein